MSGIYFPSPSFRAAASDLTVAISPLGLVELADEEFEVHGPRMNRYSSNWAWYLGHHWAHRREIGEPQLTFNWVKAFSDYLTNFSFGKGVHFHSPEATAAITPYLLKEVWDNHNAKDKIIAEMAQLGSVSGDVFVKVAFEPPFIDPAGVPQEPRIRILPLNPAFVFPEWHPHDKDRMIRCKLKWKFWGTAQDGARMVMTYVELLTEDLIEEYINDELIDRRPNPIGRIPIAHCPNIQVASSPWGLADITDIVPLNREYNEKATEISDIINYHVAPVTVITGAKPNNLEKGAGRVWAINSPNAKVEQLSLETNFTGPLGYMELLKQTMHELTGVPGGALGTQQPISNTSGVALAMQFQPLMLKHERKKINYTRLFEQVNELVIRHAFVFAPELTIYNPYLSSVQLQEGQFAQLDPSDPVSYRTYVDWPSPLPTDRLLKINEIQAMMAMQLESRKGALRELGIQFPEQKMREVFEELLEDQKQAAALQLINSQLAAFNLQATGMTPDGMPMMTEDAEGNAQPMMNQVPPEIAQELLGLAYNVFPPETSDFGSEDAS